MKCDKCGSINIKKFRNETPKGGHLEGYKCSDCGHMISWYVPPDKQKIATDMSYHYVEHVKKNSKGELIK